MRAHTCTRRAVALIGTGPGNHTAHGNYLRTSCDSKKRTQTLVGLVVVTQLNLTQLKETKEPVFVEPALFSFCVIPADPPTDLFLYFFQAPPPSLLVGLFQVFSSWRFQV